MVRGTGEEYGLSVCCTDASIETASSERQLIL